MAGRVVHVSGVGRRHCLDGVVCGACGGALAGHVYEMPAR